VLRALRLQEKPAEKVLSNYFAVVDAELCTECDTCADRCPMDAIAAAEGPAMVDLDRCIGCGLCVTTCPAEAVTLQPKSPAAQHTPPRTARETMMQLAAQRGKSLVPLATMRKG
jgi:Fe-S-cluster-containing hydrogenase component 2